MHVRPEHGLGAPTTPSKRGVSLVTFYNQELRPLIDFDLPFEEVNSPSRQPRSCIYQIVKVVTYLYYKAQCYLDDVLAELAAKKRQDRTADSLLEILMLARQRVKSTTISPLAKADPESFLYLSPIARLESPLAKIQNTSELSIGNVRDHELAECARKRDDRELMPPPSPTLAIKHNMAHLVPLDLDPSLSRTMSESTIFPQLQGQSFTSAMTSFTSDSSVMYASQETVATSVDGSSQISEIMFSSLDDTAVYQLELDVIAAQGVAPNIESSKIEGVATKPIDYRVRDVPKHSIAAELPNSLLALPYFLRPLVYRAAQYCKISPEELDRQWSYPRSFDSLHTFANDHRPTNAKIFPRGQKTDHNEYPLLGRLVWAEKGDRLLRLELVQSQKMLLNVCERHFGPDRFLIIDSCQFNKPPRGLKQYSEIVEKQVLEMLSLDQHFLGRTWAQILSKDRKRGRDMIGETDSSAPSTYKLYFFATNGDGLENISVAELVNWFIPLQLNQHQPACKAFTRLDLAMSRTVPTLAFEAEQINYGDFGLPDIKASDVPEPWSDRWIYDDVQRVKDSDDQFDMEEVMNDGCEWISVAAMDTVRQKLELDFMPTAIQGRIFGAKGVWCCHYEDLPTTVRPSDIWINISKSQVKVKRNKDLVTDAELRTLQVLKHTHSLSTSFLYPGFLPIMLDRGVPAQVILGIAQYHTKVQVDEFVTSVDHPPSIHRWLHSNHDLVARRERVSGMRLVAGMPENSAERAVQMLEHGFQPMESRYLADEVLASGRRVLDMQVKNCRIPLYQSTSAIGVPDLCGHLAPGQIHISFSDPIRDPVTGQYWSTLQDMDVLVARNPSQRDSDIQKVRAVYNQHLARFKDVVFFSTRGRRPLASKLSGGDYDGDTFIIYWDSELVSPFRNAPAPRVLTPIEELGITKDTITVGELIPSAKTGIIEEDEVRAFVNRQAAARMRYSYLGTVTNAHGDLTYHNSDIGSLQANKYNDLHDHLVDADKNGYQFSETSHIEFRRNYGILNRSPPMYRTFMKTDNQGNWESKVEAIPRKGRRWVHILDRLYFDVLLKEVTEAEEVAKKILKKADMVDEDLIKPYEQLRTSTHETSIHQKEMQSLQKKFRPLVVKWDEEAPKFRAKSRQSTDWPVFVESLRILYTDIMPDDIAHDVVQEWLRPQDRALNMWEKLKASAFASQYQSHKNRLVFAVAGAELCVLKAQASPHRFVLLPLYYRMMPSKRREMEALDDTDTDPDVPESEFGESASVFDGHDGFHSAARQDPCDPYTPQTPQSRKRLQHDFILAGAEREESESPTKRRQSSLPERRSS